MEKRMTAVTLPSVTIARFVGRAGIRGAVRLMIKRMVNLSQDAA
jgi:hypothetical protein